MSQSKNCSDTSDGADATTANASESSAEKTESTSGSTTDPILAGTFAVYTAPDGGYVLVTDIPGQGVTHKHLPGALVRMVTGDGIMGRTMSKFLGGGGNAVES